MVSVLFATCVILGLSGTEKEILLCTLHEVGQLCTLPLNFCFPFSPSIIFLGSYKYLGQNTQCKT